jgi:hypothetical protein
MGIADDGMHFSSTCYAIFVAAVSFSTTRHPSYLPQTIVTVSTSTQNGAERQFLSLVPVSITR